VKAVFKDIVELNLIDNRAKAMSLLKPLAYQIGSLVSYVDLSNRLDISAPTVQRYIEIFEHSYLIYRLYSYSQRKERKLANRPRFIFGIWA